MSRSVEKLGKVGRRVYGKNRYGPTEYALVVPANPRTAAQQANRHSFGDLGPAWGKLLTEPERALWLADARHHRTHGRPGQSAPLTGFQWFMSVNAPRVRQGLPILRVPTSAPASPLPSAVSHSPFSSPARPLPAPAASTLDFRPETLDFGLRTLDSRFPSRVPVHYRTATVATRHQHASAPLGPRACLRSALAHARAGPRRGQCRTIA